MARLGRLVGRGRALEILLGGDDIPAGLAAEYGYVNRVIPDAEEQMRWAMPDLEQMTS